MTWTVTKDGVSVTADTEPELAIAVAVLNTDTTVAERVPVGVNAIGRGYLGEALRFPYSTVEEPPKPKLAVVSTESDDSVAESPAVQHIPVSPENLETLDCISLFSEGVPARGISELLGVKVGTIHSRLQSLKKQGLVERVRGHQLWIVTPKARRAKLVKS
jgi:hypothetical protein